MDIMSVKKKDQMVFASAPNPNPNPGTTLSVGTVLTITPTTTNKNYGSTHCVLFNPAARFLTSSGPGISPQRTATTVYNKGYSESILIIPSDSSVWWWRRIVFTLKGPITAALFNNGYIQAQAIANDITTRKLRDLTGNNAAGNDFVTGLDQLYLLLFNGVFTTDWTSPINAPLDKKRVTVLSDRTTNLHSQNDVALPRRLKRYYPLNKNMVFDDDENGTTITPRNMSTQAKPGMGDVYVCDLFACPVPDNGESSTLAFSATGTMYWHEK